MAQAVPELGFQPHVLKYARAMASTSRPHAPERWRPSRASGPPARHHRHGAGAHPAARRPRCASDRRNSHPRARQSPSSPACPKQSPYRPAQRAGATRLPRPQQSWGTPSPRRPRRASRFPARRRRGALRHPGADHRQDALERSARDGARPLDGVNLLLVFHGAQCLAGAFSPRQSGCLPPPVRGAASAARSARRPQTQRSLLPPL